MLRGKETNMIDIQDKEYCPALEEVGEYVGRPCFLKFCSDIRRKYGCGEKVEFSAGSMARGWNIKFKKAGRALCTVYPREGYFTVLVVIGTKEKEAVEAMLPECEARLQEIYHETQEGNGQRWLMIDLEEEGRMYEEVLRLIEIRRGPAACRN